jgi:hypothetical protein
MRPELEVGVTRCSRSLKRAPPSDFRGTAGSELSHGYSKGQIVSPHLFFLFFFSLFSLLIASLPRLASNAYIYSFPPSSLLSPTTLAMIMVQKPVHLLSSPSTHHHRRHPSAPPTVLVQPTRIPGLLSLSKPAPITPTRPQQQHHQNHNNRQSRSTHTKTKPTSTARHSSQSPAAAAAAQPKPQPTEDLNKPVPLTRPPAKSNNTVSTLLSPSPEKPPRGRQNSKQSKDKSKPR